MREIYLNQLPVWSSFAAPTDSSALPITGEDLTASESGRVLMVTQDDHVVVRDRLSGLEKRIYVPLGIRPLISTSGKILNLISDTEFELLNLSNVLEQSQSIKIQNRGSEVFIIGLSKNEETVGFVTRSKKIVWKNIKTQDSVRVDCDHCRTLQLGDRFHARWSSDLSRLFLAQKSLVVVQQISGGGSIVPTEGHVLDIMPTPDGKQLWVLKSNTIEKWIWGRKGQWELAAEILEKDGPPMPMRLGLREMDGFARLVLSKDGRYLFLGSANPATWDVFKASNLKYEGSLQSSASNAGSGKSFSGLANAAVLVDVETTIGGSIIGLDKFGVVHRLEIGKPK